MHFNEQNISLYHNNNILISNQLQVASGPGSVFISRDIFILSIPKLAPSRLCSTRESETFRHRYYFIVGIVYCYYIKYFTFGGVDWKRSFIAGGCCGLLTTWLIKTRGGFVSYVKRFFSVCIIKYVIINSPVPKKLKLISHRH